jgi:hypothetical protein
MSIVGQLRAVSDAAERVLKALEHDTFLADVLLEFVQQEITGPEGELTAEFRNRQMAGSEYYPKWLTSSAGGRASSAARFGVRNGAVHYPLRTYDGIKVLAGMQQGFSDLLGAVQRTLPPTVHGRTLTVGVGPTSGVFGLKLSPYMQMQGSPTTASPLNSLFQAVEYGTGVEDNVGPGWVRASGPTKAKTPRGSWWLGRQGTGMLFTGQKGFHFLYDARTRQPLQIYGQIFRRRFPDFLRRALGHDSGAVFS